MESILPEPRNNPQVGMVNIPVPKSLKRQMSFWVTVINDAGLAHSIGGGPLGSHGGVP